MLTESAICARHSHVVEGSVSFNPMLNKQTCTILTRGMDGSFDGNTRVIATSDLHQTFWTVETKKALDKLKAKAKRAARRVVRQDAEPIVILEDGEMEALDEPVDGLAKLRELVGA